MEESHGRVHTREVCFPFLPRFLILAAVMDGNIPYRPSLPSCVAPSCAAQRVTRP